MNLKPAMKATSSLAAAGVLIASSIAYADELRIVSWGGAYQKGQSVGIFQPVAKACLLYTSPSPRDVEESRMPSSA